MLVMIKTDLITMKNYALQNVVIMTLVAVFICIGTGSITAGIAALMFMLPFLYIFSVVAYDEMNGWERFRLTMPISRNQVAFGRYASVLIAIAISVVLALVIALVISLVTPHLDFAAGFDEGFSLAAMTGRLLLIAAFLLFVTSVVLPLFIRFGMTKATRIVPLAFLLLALAFMFVSTGSTEGAIEQSLPLLVTMIAPAPDQEGFALLCNLAVFAIMLVPYVASSLLTAKLYEKRQL